MNKDQTTPLSESEKQRVIRVFAREKKCLLIIISAENPENIEIEKGRGMNRWVSYTFEPRK